MKPKPSEIILQRANRLDASTPGHVDVEIDNVSTIERAILEYLDSAHGRVPPPDNRTWDQIYAGKQPTVTVGENEEPATDPDILRAAEGVVLEPGEYRGIGVSAVRRVSPGECLACGRPVWTSGDASGCCVEAAGYLPTGFGKELRSCKDVQIENLRAEVETLKSALARGTK